ncbi:MAG: histidine phosphatase family protein [Clostridiales bacterium]|nr:histidine phosphatase family protein [Clostridiales bacterium]
MTTLLIIRHGNTDANLKGIYAGHTDAMLTDVGIKQAELVCNYVFNNYKVDAIYASDLTRAIETAKPLAKMLDLEINIDAELKEMYGGEWEGKKFLDLPSLYPEDFSVWQNDVGHSRCTGGESYEEVCNRAFRAIERIAKSNIGKTVAIVSHGGYIRGLECAVRGVDLKDMASIPYVANASVSVITYDNKKLKMQSAGFNDFLGTLNTEMPKGI